MHAVVKDVEVCTVPFTVGDEGERWDLFSGPDLYYEAYGPEETCLHTSDVVNDVGPRDLPVALGGEFSIEARAQYALRLLDADLFGHEVVARIDFAPGRLIEQSRGPDPPRTVRLEDGETALRLTLSWVRDES
jgi:hypothetical protein